MGGAERRSTLVKEHARAVGFDLVGVAPPALPEAAARYEEAMACGYGAEMEWLRRDPGLRRDVRAVHPTTRAVVVVGLSYGSDTPGYVAEPPTPEEGWIARYAQGKDYHVVVRRLLVRLVRRFEADPALGYRSLAHRVFVDTGPVLEKAYAARAGLGWMGKNTLLINQRFGSWLFLGVVLTPLDLAFDAPKPHRCGTCRRCLEACPTRALVPPGVLDGRRCISTWTIESPEPQAVIDAERLGQHVFGCDLCQEVCPWNRKAWTTRLPSLAPRPDNVRPRLSSLAGLTDEQFKRRFPRSAVRRVDARRLTEVIAVIQDRNARERR